MPAGVHPATLAPRWSRYTAKGRRLFDEAVEKLNTDLFGSVGLDEDELDLLVGLIGKIRAADGDVVTVTPSPSDLDSVDLPRESLARPMPR